jgi:aerobic-type carbon monoxide dehydrogenase small subunit (CoxS/CutS family)
MTAIRRATCQANGIRQFYLEAGAGPPVVLLHGFPETSFAWRKVQEAWLDLEVVQCGYCQSGQIMSAAALIERNPAPDDAQIDAAMAGNICRCATYARIRAAIKSASRT